MQQYTEQRSPAGRVSPQSTYHIISPGRDSVRLPMGHSQLFASVPQGYPIRNYSVQGYYAGNYPIEDCPTQGYPAQEYPAQRYLSDQLQGVPLLIGLGVIASGIISWYFVNFNYEYSDALEDVASYANFNYWKKEVKWYEAPVYVAWPKRYDSNYVQNIVNAYMNLVLEDDTLPEYSAYSPTIQKRLFTEMSKILPYSVRDMQYVMNAVDYGVSDGTVKILAMKLPRTAHKHQRMYSKPQVVQEEIERYNDERDKSLLEEVTDLLSTIGIAATVSGLAIGGLWLYNILSKRG